MLRRLRVLIALALASSTVASSAAPATRPADHAAALRLLKEECVACHNPEKKKGGLVLTDRLTALAGGDGGAALVPGRPGESPLIQVLSPDADPHMPPKKQLSAGDVAALTAWVAGGAPWDERALAGTPGGSAGTTRSTRFRDLPATYGPVLAVALSPDEKTLAVGRGARVVLHDLTKPDRPVAVTLGGLRDAVQSLAWSPDGNRLAAGDHGRVLVWDARRPGETPAELAGLTGRVTALLFLKEKDALVAADGGAGSPGRLHKFRLPDGRPQASVDAHADSILSLARDGGGGGGVRPADTLLATGGGDRAVRLWDAATLKPVATLEGHTGRVAAVAFNAAGTLLASGSADRDLKVWDVKTRERKVSVGPYAAPVTGLAWAGEKTIAVTCEDGTVRLNASDRTEIARPLPATAEDVIYCLATTADGKTLIAGCHDGQVYVWAGGKLVGKLAAGSDPPAGP